LRADPGASMYQRSYKIDPPGAESALKKGSGA
jgi:hypothetical protein